MGDILNKVDGPDDLKQLSIPELKTLARNGRVIPFLKSGGRKAKMKRFFYSAIQGVKECEGVIYAESIDAARKKLMENGYEEITLGVLSSPPPDFDQDGLTGFENPAQPQQ